MKAIASITVDAAGGGRSMNRVRWALGLSAALAAANPSVAQPPAEAPAVPINFLPKHHKRGQQVPVVPAIPAVPEAKETWPPVEPKTPTDPKEPKKDPAAPKKDPVLPKDPATPEGDPLARAPEAGTQPAESFNPNMFGDFFGRRSVRTTVVNRRLFEKPIADTNGVLIPYRGIAGSSTFLQQPLTAIVVNDGGRRSPPFLANFQATTPILDIDRRKLLVENPQYTAVLQALNPDATLAYLAARSNARGTAAGSGNVVTWTLQPSYLLTDTVTTDLAFPASSGVGRQKISEDNNPTPGDRFILNYDAYENTRLTPGGFDVQRYAIGGEYSILGGVASGQAVLPFASTIDPVGNGFATRDTIIGDLALIGKVLVVDGFNYDIAAGVGVSLPTAPDTVFRGPGGSDLVRVRNESYGVTPFVAASWMPVEGVFTQAWAQVTYDTTGNELQLAAVQGGPLVSAGQIYDPALLQLDFQLGYWLFQGPGGGLAPYVELHYNQTLGNGQTPTGSGISIGAGREFSELNLSFGFAAIVGDAYVNVGMAVPLRDGNDQFFDYQLGVRVNYLFGPGRGTGVPPGPGSPPPR